MKRPKASGYAATGPSRGAVTAVQAQRILDFCSDLPEIEVHARHLRHVTSDGIAAVAAVNNPPHFFRRGSGLVHLDVGSADGAICVTQLTGRSLRHHLARCADWMAKGVLCAPPMAVVHDIESTLHLPDIPILDAVVTCPVATPDGEIIVRPGYHAVCRLWYQPAPDLELPPEVPRLSNAAVRNARQFIEDNLFIDFPFGAASDRAVAWACMILPFLRRMIDGPTPLHLFHAPAPGSGKTLLALCAMVPAMGRHLPEPMTIDCEEPEMRKRITSALIEARTAVLLDNLGQGRQLGSSSLASVLTARMWSDRLLGQSRLMSVPVECIWMATANNPRLSDEMVRRTVTCGLDSGLARPHMRRIFKHERILSWALAHRSLLVQAILTLIRAWQLEGQPRGDAHLGMYEAWAQVVDGVLRVAGIDGLAQAIERFQGVPTDTETALGPFIKVWVGKHGAAVVGVKDLFTVAVEAGCAEAILDAHLSDREHRRHRGGEGERAQQTRLGIALRRLSGQVVFGHRIEEMGLDRCGRQTYRLTKAAEEARR